MNHRAHPEWNDFVKSFQSEALDWHSIWISSGRPQSGFVSIVCDMRRSSRKAYHKQVDFVLKRESKIKGVKIAESFLRNIYYLLAVGALDWQDGY